MSAAIGEDGYGTARVEGKDFVVRAAVIGGPRTVSRASYRTLVVVDRAFDGAGQGIGRAGNAVAVVGLGPTVERAVAAGSLRIGRDICDVGVFGFCVGLKRFKVAADVLGDRDRLTRAIGDLRNL